MVAATGVFLAVALDVAGSSVAPQSSASTTLFIGLVLALFVMPLLLVALAVLMLDRLGRIPVLDYPIGSPLLYETLFWIFGHPEVYLLILPFAGLFVFIRKLSGVFSTPRGHSSGGLHGTILRVVF